MKGTPRPSGRSAAFTLLEILMVLAIIALLLGVVIPLTSGFSRDQEFRDVMRELLVLAKTARMEAMTTGRPASVVFDKEGFALFRAGDDEEPSEIVEVPSNMTYTLRPFGADKSLRPDGQRWMFQPTGICEPVSVNLTDGEAWMEMRFDPLTASIADESYYIP